MNTSIKTYQELIGNRESFELGFSNADLNAKIASSFDTIIVLDDDPTGTQTVHDIPVLTEWSISAIGNELDRGTTLFYVLTNSRSLSSDKAKNLGLEIANNIKHVAGLKSKKCLIISRSDSTLRGHYPLEIDLLMEVFQPNQGVQFIVPAFFEGGRYTVEDIHYVREGDQMIPAAETPFAKDKVFGFQSSDLKNWVIEKFNGNMDPTKIQTLSIHELENESVQSLAAKINTFKPHDVCIINAFVYAHLKKALYSIFSSEVDPYFRSAASLVAALAGQIPKFVEPSGLSLDLKKGGLTVLGSYVPKSTAQLEHVIKHLSMETIEIDVKSLLDGSGPSAARIAQLIDQHIARGTNVIVYTSRVLISAKEVGENLKIGFRISNFLTDIVSILKVTPRYIIGKGGITSSDLATKSLKIKRAMVLGQMIPGVPIWETQAESKFPGTPFIVYPGNVGDHSGLTQVIQKLNSIS